MCLPDFEFFDNISKDNPLIGYRSWRLLIEEPNVLMSESQVYKWNKVVEGPHLVTESNSGIYAYNNNYYNYNNNYYYYNNYYNNNNNYYYYSNYYNNNNNYNLAGIIHQYGKVAIHKVGQRSEYATIDTLFTVRETDVTGLKEFIDWIKKFNLIIFSLAKKYDCKTIHYQDFIELQQRTK